MAKIFSSLTELIGNTPLMYLNNIAANHGVQANLIEKIEFFNPGGSVKDRVALSMIEDAEKSGKLNAVILMEDGKRLPELPEAYEEEAVAKLDVLGIDLGVKELAVCSDGRTFRSIRSARKHERLLKRSQKALSRKQSGSKNRDKARVKVAKVHEKIRACRSDAIHKMTYQISESQADVIAIEDLNVKGMLKNHRLASSISEASFSEIRRQLEYKCARKGKALMVIPRFAASTQTCSLCGSVNRGLRGFEGLGIRTWECPRCHAIHGRDLNAAKVIAKHGRDSLPRVAGESQACGEADCGRQGAIP